MKKKIVVFCFFVLMVLMILPVVTSYCVVSERQPFMARVSEKQDSDVQEKPVPMELIGYLLIHVSVYTPGEGLHPYVGANISVKGFFFSYNGQTDERGDCLFQVHTKLFRAKLYFIKVSIPPGDWLHKKLNSIYIQPQQIVYKDFLFVVL
ncbi:MAG TPA: hypothetical protein VN377_04905 [Candidatus Thermoplasmatota archaeon]|nr:hypothetical protein [Candidatus Thermoplasmatota archaeon]